MRYVAFDIESPNGMFLEGNICEFGYAITDEQFNIVESDNILVKPIVPSYNHRVKLAYSHREYANAPSFVDSYDRIASILGGSDTIVVGHAIHNDILCMVSACKAHGVVMPDFMYIDSQVIFSIHKQEKSVCSLDKIARDLEIDFRHHRADEDARLALLTIMRVCKEKECSLPDIIKEYDISYGRVEAGFVVNCRTPQFTSAAPSINSRNSKKRLINHFLINHKPGIIDMENKHGLCGKRIVMELEIEYNDVDLSRRIIQRVADIGGKYLRYGNSYDILVTSNQEMLLKHPKSCVTLERLVELLGELPIIIFDDLEILEQIREEKSRVRQEARYTTIYNS